MTREEKIKAYKKMSKRELAELLIDKENELANRPVHTYPAYQPPRKHWWEPEWYGDPIIEPSITSDKSLLTVHEPCVVDTVETDGSTSIKISYHEPFTKTPNNA